jgi:hypothetical protein
LKFRSVLQFSNSNYRPNIISIRRNETTIVDNHDFLTCLAYISPLRITQVTIYHINTYTYSIIITVHHNFFLIIVIIITLFKQKYQYWHIMHIMNTTNVYYNLYKNKITICSNDNNPCRGSILSEDVSDVTRTQHSTHARRVGQHSAESRGFSPLWLPPTRMLTGWLTINTRGSKTSIRLFRLKVSVIIDVIGHRKAPLGSEPNNL